MKLYSTIRSERAMKGQGGKYLDIEIFTTNPNQATHKIQVREMPGKITIDILEFHFDKWSSAKNIDTIYINETKGEKQKGDKCPYCKYE